MTRSTPAPIRLTDLPIGGVGRLHAARIDDSARSLLRSLGLVDDCRLRVCQNGEPCIIQVRATRIALSPVIARNLFVIPEPAATGAA